MINLKVKLADGTSVNPHELAKQIRTTDTLTIFLNQEALVHPTTLQWIEGNQSFYIAERDNEEDAEGNAGGFLPYNEFGELIRDLPDDEQSEITEDEYYYQIAEIQWEGENDFETFVANWMNRNRDSYKDLVTHGCVSGMVGELIYHNQIIQCIKKHKHDLEAIIQDLADSLDNMNFLFKPNNFSFDILVWMCFEETVKKALQNLDIEDI